MSDAEHARRCGYVVGDILEGEECGKVARIQILYIGEETLLCRELPRGRESTWTLRCRDWRKVGHTKKVFP